MPHRSPLEKWNKIENERNTRKWDNDRKTINRLEPTLQRGERSEQHCKKSQTLFLPTWPQFDTIVLVFVIAGLTRLHQQTFCLSFVIWFDFYKSPKSYLNGNVAGKRELTLSLFIGKIVDFYDLFCFRTFIDLMLTWVGFPFGINTYSSMTDNRILLLCPIASNSVTCFDVLSFVFPICPYYFSGLYRIRRGIKYEGKVSVTTLYH